MLPALTKNPQEFIHWNWQHYEPYIQDLLSCSLTKDNVGQWLSKWTRLSEMVRESYNRLYVAVTLDTMDEEAEKRFHAFLDGVFLKAQAAEQKLKEKLLASGLDPEGFHNALRQMRAEAALFREENLPLLSEERKLSARYDKLIGAQTVEWDGQELTLTQLRPVYQDPDRHRRERAWRLAAGRQLADREAINSIWANLMDLRRQLAENADQPDYRAYRWQQLLRLDYTPADAKQFGRAIEEVVVPAAARIYEKHRRRLGLASLRPWDLDRDLYPVLHPPLPGYGTGEDLERVAGSIFLRVDPWLGEYFCILRRENLLDLANRKGKAPGAYCTSYPVSRRPFIFMNAVGLSDDVRTILHETGHAFHVFETIYLPYVQQRHPSLEFAEVASMSMELLAYPYLSREKGGLYSEADAARARIEHLEHVIVFWPYMAVVDAFQHWVYENHAAAVNAANCDAAWLDLWQRYIPGVDWSGLEAEAMTGWHRKLHIHRYPFYYLEYGLAQLGAVQVWSNALKDQAGAVSAYRRGLALGNTVPLPELYKAAGGRLAFDAATLAEAVHLIESTVDELELRV
jgi:oligoendopeptidase F